MSPKLTLYTFKLSLWAGSPRLAINELGIPDVKLVEVDLSKAENFSPEYLKKNPHHTVPTLEITNDDGSKKYLTDTKAVVAYLDEITGSALSPTDKKTDIDAFLEEMHERADVGNPLFFTSGSREELEGKKSIVPPFLQGRIDGWKNYLNEAPEHKDLYSKNIKETQDLLDFYQGNNDENILFEMNKQLWATGEQFLNKVEKILAQNGGEYLFGDYTVADVHFTPYLFRCCLVRQPELVFENRPKLKSYYERIQARPSFKKTFEA